MGRNAVYLCAYNGLELTKQAIESALAQDVDGGVDLWLVNNGSTDGGATHAYLEELSCSADPLEGSITHLSTNESPCVVANRMLGEIFAAGYGEVLTIPNDVILPSNLYREFLRWPRGVVTASMTDSRDHPQFATSTAVSENMPMCVVMWRHWAHDAIVERDGYFFDPRFAHYTSDCDLALRLSACGIHGIQLDLQYFHVGSASHKLAPQEVGDKMREQADIDRAAFVAKWGWPVTDHNYGQAAMDINFRGEPIK